MKEEARKLIDIVTQLEKEKKILDKDLDFEKHELTRYQNACQHNYTEPIYDPIHNEANDAA